MLFIFFLVTAITALVVYLQKTYSKLSRAGVHHLPVVPFFGNLMRGIMKKEHMLISISKVTDAFPDDRIVGRYELLTPVYIINDPELLRKVTISDFDYFTDRRAFTSESDPMFGRNLLSMEGEQWRAMRSNLSPLFTSSKMRLMVPFILEVTDRIIQVLSKRIQESESGYFDVEGKELASRYGNDVLASCAFGLQVESHTEDNEFYAHARAMTNFNFLRFLKTCAFRSFPHIVKWLNMSLVPPGTAEFFRDVVVNTIKHREENKIIRHDMIHLLMLARKGQITFENKDKAGDEGYASVEEVNKRKYHVDWTERDLIGQAVLFVFASFDTLSSGMAFMIHQLAINEEVQEKLYQEIIENEENCGGKFEFTNISKLVYLDMFTSECLRCWPAGPFMDRCCVKDYNLGKPHPGAKQDVIIRKGEVIGLPYWSFHYNPRYFPDPEKFDPERFSEENKHNIKPYTFMPFGSGFRNCIGSRFALLEMKIFIYKMLLNFKFSAFDKTPPKARLTNRGYDMKIDGEAWVRLHLRSTGEN